VLALVLFGFLWLERQKALLRGEAGPGHGGLEPVRKVVNAALARFNEWTGRRGER